MPPPESHLIYGRIFQTDGTTPLSNTPVYLINETQNELIETTTNDVGEYVFDCYNFTTYENGDELIVLGMSNLYTRRIISALTITNTKDYRFTIKISFEDASIGNGLLVNAGLNEIRDWMGGVVTTAPTHIEWNDSTLAVDATHTDSDWDTGGSNEQRNAIESAKKDTPTSLKWTTVLTTAQLDGVDITKSGIFNASSGDDLFAEILYGATSKTTLFAIIETDLFNVVS